MNLYQEPVVELFLVFDKSLAYQVYERFDQTEELANSDFLVKISLPNNEELYRFLLSFGSQVEVLAPNEVREQLVLEVKEMYEKYQP